MNIKDPRQPGDQFKRAKSENLDKNQFQSMQKHKLDNIKINDLSLALEQNKEDKKLEIQSTKVLQHQNRNNNLFRQKSETYSDNNFNQIQLQKQSSIEFQSPKSPANQKTDVFQSNKDISLCSPSMSMQQQNNFFQSQNNSQMQKQNQDDIISQQGEDLDQLQDIQLYKIENEEEIYIDIMNWILEKNASNKNQEHNLKKSTKEIKEILGQNQNSQEEEKQENLQQSCNLLEIDQEQNNKAKIKNESFLQVLMSFYGVCSDNLKLKILKDITKLIQQNYSNAVILNNYYEFKQWLLDLILECQFIIKDNQSEYTQNIQITQQFQKSAYDLLQTMSYYAFLHDSEGHSILSYLKTWAVTKSKLFENTNFQNIFETQIKEVMQDMVKIIFENNFENKNLSYLQVNHNLFWNNIAEISYIAFEITYGILNLTLFSKTEDQQQTFQSLSQRLVIKQDSQNKQIWINQKLIQTLLDLQLRYIGTEYELFQAIIEQKDYSSLNQQSNQNIQHKIENTLDKIGFSNYNNPLLMQIIIYFITTTIDYLISDENQIDIQQVQKHLDQLQILHFQAVFCLEFCVNKKYFVNNNNNLQQKQNQNQLQLENNQNQKELIFKNGFQSDISYIYNYLVNKNIQFQESEHPVRQIFEKVYIQIIKDGLQVLDFIQKGIKNLDKFENFIAQENYLRLNNENNSLNELKSCNFFLHELYHLYIVDQNNNLILSQKVIDFYFKNQQLQENQENIKMEKISNTFLEYNWIIALTQSTQIIQLIECNYSIEILENYAQNVIASCKERHQLNYQSFELNEKHQEDIVNKINQDIYDHSIMVHEQHQYFKSSNHQQQDQERRISKNLWKKIWKRQRVFNGLWTHQEFKAQNNMYMDKQKLTYEKRKENELFYYKVDKYETKQRSRIFLKLKLIEPELELKYQNILENQVWINQLQNIDISTTTNFVQSQNYRNKKNLLANNVIVNLGKNITKGIGKGIQNTFKKFVNPLIHNQLSSNEKQLQKKNPPNKDLIKNKQNIQEYEKLAISTEGKEVSTQFQQKCQWIKTLTVRQGTLIVTTSSVIFMYETLQQTINHVAVIPHKIPQDRTLIKQWSLQLLVEAYIRKYILRLTAIELFLKDGQTLLFNFSSVELAQQLWDILMGMRKNYALNLKQISKSQNPEKILESAKFTKKWKNYEISNFEYLMYINSLGSRSYKDLMQYPIFPWIVNDNKSQKIDIYNKLHFRDLSLTMGAIGNPERKQQYIDRYNSIDPDGEMKPFHFGSPPSSPAITYQYLLRIQPYTLGAKILQNGKFDISDRLFQSIEESYRCASEEMADIRELVPEFYYMPEFLLNQNKLDLGLLQTGNRVDHVNLPLWCKDNPYFYVYYLKKVLETPYVSQNIHSWIDLMFGYKQRGEEAEKNLNLYYYMMYDDQIDLEQMNLGEQERIAYETQIINFGQVPSQVLKKPHTQRKPYQYKGPYVCDEQAKLKVFKPQSKISVHSQIKMEQIINNQQGSLKHEFKFSTLKSFPDSAIIKLKWISTNKLLSIRRNGVITIYKWWNTPINANIQMVLPFQLSKAEEKKTSLTNCELNFSSQPQNLQFLSKKISILKDPTHIGSKQMNPNQKISLFDASLNLTNYPICIINKGQDIVLGGFLDGRIVVRNIETDQFLGIYPQHSHTVSVIMSDEPKDKILLTGTTRGDVIMWEIVEGNKIQEKFHFYDHTDTVSCFSINKQMRIFITGSYDGYLNIYNLYSGQYYRSIQHPNNLPINFVNSSIYGLPCVVFGSNESKQIYSYNINGQLLMKLEENVVVTSFTMMDTEFTEIIIYSTINGEIIIRELPFLTIRQKISVQKSDEGYTSLIFSMLVSSENKFLLCGNSDGEVPVITDPTRQEEQQVIKKQKQSFD